MTQFEIDRMEFSTDFGFIKNVKKEQTQMILSFILVIKVMIINILINPYQFAKSIQINNQIIIKYNHF